MNQEFEAIIETTPWWEMLETTAEEYSGSKAASESETKELLNAIQDEMYKIVSLEECFEAPSYRV